MDYAEFIDSSISIDDLFKNADCLFFRNDFSQFDHFSEVSSITELGDDASMRYEGYDLVEFDDVLDVGEQSKDFHFVVEERLVYLTFDIFHIDEFEGQWITLVMRRVPLF